MFLKNDDVKYEESFKTLINVSYYYSEPINKPRTLKNLLKSYLVKLPLTVYRNFSPSFKRKVKEVINSYDIVFIDHYLMFQYVPKNFTGKVILHQHNAEYILWKRMAEIEKNWFKKAIIYIESYRIKKYEKKICKKADVILASPNDIQHLSLLGINPKKFVTTYHLGNTELLNAPPLQFQNTTKSLLYVGTLSWEPNVDGLIWFLNRIWENIKKKNPELILYIIGKNPDHRLINLVKEDKSIHLVGFISEAELEKYYSTCRVFIAPLRFGSGIKVKVVNALYRGIPTVTTSVGAEGLEVLNERDIMIADNENDFAESIDRLLNDEKLWTLISINSRMLMKKKYTWEEVFKNLEKALL